MEIVFLIAMASSLVVILLWVMYRLRTGKPESERRPIPAMVFSLWVIATAVFGPRFFVVRIPGLFDFTVDRLLFIFLLIALAVMLFSDRPRARQNLMPEWLIACFALVCLFSMVAHGFRPVLAKYPAPWFLFLNGYLMPFIAFLFAKSYMTEDRALEVLFHSLFYFGVYLSITAFFEFFNLRQYVVPSYINDPEIWLHLDRARGPFLNAAFNGTAINIGFLCGVHLLSRKRGFKKIAYVGMLALFFPAVFFTQTRSVYLGFLISLGALLLLYRTSFPKWKVFATPLLLAAVVMLAYVPNFLSVNRRAGGILQMAEVDERFALIRRSFLIFTDHPFFGVGIGQFTPTSELYRGLIPIPSTYTELIQHNHLLGMLVELGLAGTIIYLLLVGCFFRHLYRLIDKLPDKGFLGVNFLLVSLLIMLVYLNNNLFVEPSFFLFVNATFFACVGTIEGMYNRFVTE